MGKLLMPDIVDIEIEKLVNTIINKNFDFLQVSKSNSGWKSPDGRPSNDLDNRVWVGSPFIMIQCLDNTKALSDLLPFLLKSLMNDETTQSQEIRYKEIVGSFGITDRRQIVDIKVKYIHEKVHIIIDIIDNYDRTPYFIHKVWQIIKKVFTDYKDTQL